MDPSDNSPAVVQDILLIQDYLRDWHVRVTWIAFMTLLVFWGLTWFIRNAFGGDSNTVVHSNTQVAHDPHLVNNNVNTVNHNSVNDPEVGGVGATTTTAPVGTTTTTKHSALTAPAWSVKVFNRLNRAHDMLRDLVLLLLSCLTLNTFARASTRGVMIIAWIFVALAFVTFAVEAAVEHRYLRLLYSVIFYALTLAIVGIAYAYGFA